MGVLSVLQGLATPAIAGAGLMIAWQQKRLADIRLQNDLFDRRYKIFEAARTLIRNACKSIDVTIEDLRAFSLDTADAAFFFDQDVLDYLADLYRRAGRLPSLRLIIEGHGGEDINAAISERYATANWLVAETTGIVARFKPSMGLSRHDFGG